MRCSMVWAMVATGFLVVVSGAEAGIDQIVGLSAIDQQSALVKRFRVSAGTVITGIVIKNNDDRTVFPKVSLFRGPAATLSEATRLGEIGNVGSREQHRMRPSIGPIVLQRAEEILVAVNWPASSGVQRVGEGAGIGATALEAAGDCFISPSFEEPLQPLLADLAISLVTEAGKAENTGLAPAEIAYRTYLAKGAISSATGQAKIEFGLARPGMASLGIYSVSGRLVRVLTKSEHSAGRHVLGWDGNDDGGRRVAGGCISRNSYRLRGS